MFIFKFKFTNKIWKKYLFKNQYLVLKLLFIDLYPSCFSTFIWPPKPATSSRPPKNILALAPAQFLAPQKIWFCFFSDIFVLVLFILAFPNFWLCLVSVSYSVDFEISSWYPNSQDGTFVCEFNPWKFVVLYLGPGWGII